MKEARYAVLIGMDKYKRNPLSYSVKDVNDVKDVLIDRCRFEEENILMVTDSIAPVKEQIDKAFELIGNKFQAGADLILFYYSGHGEYDKEDDKSHLFFEDETSIGIGDVVMQYFQPLRAKNHYLIIDACHSGKNVYVKPKHTVRKTERKLLNDSSELYFLFAAEKNKKAYQGENLKNSYYTYYLIDAIRTDRLYDEMGFLSMSSIDDHIRRKISSHSDVVQIPGSESRVTGYKPFAFLNKTEESVKEEQVVIKTEIMTNNASNFDLAKTLTPKNREKIQAQLKDILSNSVDGFNMGALENTHNINGKLKFGNIPNEIDHELEEAIITKAHKSGFEAIGDTFRVKLLKQNRKKTGLSSVFDMIHGEPVPEYSYTITYNDYYTCTTFIEVKAKSHENVSGGLYCFFYQAKYGFIFCKTFFRYEWDGADEKISNFVKVDFSPYRLTDESVSEAQGELLEALSELVENINTWSKERKNEIEAFLQKAK